MRLPSNNPVSFPYGATTAPYSPTNPHAGTDYSGEDPNRAIYAPEKMIITRVGDLGDCGLSVDATAGNRRYRFCHMADTTVIYTGLTVDEGFILGRMGETGLAYGVHLHFVMWVDGVRVDPDKTIKAIIAEENKFMWEVQPPVFKWQYYLDNNPDVKRQGTTKAWAEKHWLSYGIKEGRVSAPNFHVKEYVGNYADLTRVFGTNWPAATKHYYNTGINERRNGRKVTVTDQVTALKDKIITFIKGA